MILRFRTVLMFLALLGLFSCGGSSVSRDGAGTGGGTGGGTTPVTISMQLQFTDANGQPSSDLSEASPLTLITTVTDSNGDPVTSTLVTYTFEPEGLAVFGNDSGTASTNSEGVATIDILVGANSGAGQVTATLSSGETATTTFNSAGTVQQSDRPTSIEVLTSASSLPSSGLDDIEIYVLVKDQNGILLEGQEVLISADLSVNLEYPPANRITGSDGRVQALLSNGSDKTNRDITITATVGDLTDDTTVKVTGSRFQINGENSIVLGESTELSIFLVDSDGNGIPFESLNLVSPQGNPIVPNMPETNEKGLAKVIVDGNQFGEDKIEISALDNSVRGIFTLKVKEDNFKFDQTELTDIPVDQQQEVNLTWLSGGVPVVNSVVQLNISRGVVTDVNGTAITSTATDANGKITAYVKSPFAGPASLVAKGDKGNDENVSASISINFIATSVATMTVDASPDVIGPEQQSTITAVLRDAKGNLVKGKTVNFAIKSDQTNGNISNLSSVTDSNGKASIVYTAGSVTSDIEGVVISASIEGNTSVPPKEVKINVGSRAFDITFGTGRDVTIIDETRYEKTFSIFVTDAQSNPVKNINLSAKMRAVPLSKGGTYIKGYWDKDDPFKNWYIVPTIICDNEDLDEDGALDENEDTNQDGFLTPGILGSISFKGSSITDENGEAVIALRYPKSNAMWSSVEITVLAQSEGTESSQSQDYQLPVANSDIIVETSSPPANPFGFSNSCTDTK